MGCGGSTRASDLGIWLPGIDPHDLRPGGKLSVEEVGSQKTEEDWNVCILKQIDAHISYIIRSYRHYIYCIHINKQ